tara:strand:- start:7367 stop:12823 length:5457 start_codon:yes stop_codon:yes gene_type:complete
MATASQLQQLYVAYFGRAADPAGLDYWVAKGTTQKEFAAHMHGQDEFQTAYGTKTVEAQVNQIYQNLFNRDADTAGLLYWTAQIDNGTLELASIANDLIWNIDNGYGDATDKLTLEAKTSTATAYTAEIRLTTAAILAYQPDSTDPWKSGSDFAAAVTFMNTATSTNTPTAADVTTSVASIAKEDFGTGSSITLTSSADTKTGTTDNDIFYALNSGDLGSSDVIDGGAGGADKIIAKVAQATTNRPVLKNLEYVNYETVDANNNSADSLTLNLDQSTGVETVDVETAGHGGTADTITLQGISTDVAVKFTDDTGGANRSNNLTVTYDAVTGTADSATIVLNSTSAAATFGTVTAAGIETLTVNSNGGADASYTIVGADATTLNVIAAAKSGGTATLDAEKATSIVVTAADDLTISDSTNKLDKAFSYTFDVASGATVTAQDLTPVDTTGADTLKFTVKGAGKAVLDSNVNWGFQDSTNNDTVEVDASENSGGVTIDFGGYATYDATTSKFTGGSGDDTAAIKAGGLGTGDSLTGGDGTDTVKASQAASTTTVSDVFYDDALTGSNIPTITGFEVAEIVLLDGGGAQTIDTATATFADTLALSGTIADADTTIQNIKVGQAVKLDNLNLAGADLDLEIKSATATAPAASLTITSNLLEDSSQTYSTIHELTVDEVTSVSLDLASGDTTLTEAKVTVASFDVASTVTVTSDEKVTIAAIDAKDDATLDFTGVTNTLDVTVDTTNDYVVKGSSTAQSKIKMSTGLDKDDTISGGSASNDLVTATINGLANSSTSTTGALNISAVETIELDTVTAASSLDLTSVTGASTVSLGSAQNVTIQGLAADTSITLGIADASNQGAADFTGNLNVNLADATGTSDELTINLTQRHRADQINSEITTTGIETVNIVDKSTNAASDSKHLFNHDTDSTNSTVLNFSSSDIYSIIGANGDNLSITNAVTAAGAITESANMTALTKHTATLAVADNELYIIEVTTEATIDTATEVFKATLGTGNNILDAVDVAASADAYLLIGGADDDTTQYLYHVDNDGTAALSATEVTLVATVTTDITDGIAGLTASNFSLGEDIELDVDSVDASKLVLSGGYAEQAFDLVGGSSATKLNAATTTVDATGLKSWLTATAAADTGTTFSTYGAVETVTGSSDGDTFTIGSTGNYIGTSVGTIDGGASSDTGTFYLKDSGSLAAVEAVETLNVVVGGLSGTTSTITWGGSSKGINDATSFVLTGGSAGNTTTLSGDLTDQTSTIDASAYLGSIEITTGEDGLVVAGAADPVTIKGGQGTTDKLTIENSATDTGEFTMTGVETIVFGVDTGSSTLNLKNVSGLTSLVITDFGGTQHNAVIKKADSGMTIDVGIASAGAANNYTGANALIDLDLATTTGSSDSVTFNLANTASLDLNTSGVETVNLVAKTLGSTDTTDSVGITASNVTNGTINVSGADANDFITLDAIASGYTTVDASGLAGTLKVEASARGTDAMTITGGTGADTIAMENQSDVLDGGTSGTDTLAIAGSWTTGMINVDLSSSTDQVTTFNGAANAAIQKNFDNVDMTGWTNNNNFGAYVTGSSSANTIKTEDAGTGGDTILAGAGADIIYTYNGADSITAGEGADTIYAGLGADTITLTEDTAAIDSIWIENVSGVRSTIDTVTGFTSVDKIYIDVSVSGQFGTLHDTSGDAFDDDDQSAAVATANISAGDAALTASKNIVSWDADSSVLATGYAGSAAFITGLDGVAALTENTAQDFSEGDEILSVFYNTSASAYEVGILTIKGDEGLDEGDEEWTGLLRVDSTGITQAQVAAAITFTNA